MARKGLIESNERKKALAKKMHFRYKKLKETMMDKNIPLEMRFETALKMAKLPRNSSHVRIRSRCIETGRPRAVYRFCGLSRIVFRNEAVKGHMPGIRRSSW